MVGETLLNRYKIESELGKGGMGIVYEAHDTLLNRVVAIKFLNTEGVGTEGKARLLQEARAAAQLNHPNIVSIYDAGETEGNPFIVMELVRGNTLRKTEKQTLSNVVLMAQQICLALDHAHTNGIIHRDLKLENIVITNTQTLKLMDFGLARTADEVRLTQEGALMGTLAYIAPELIQGQPASAQSDLYALGIIFYELLVGHEPFQGNIGAVLGQHLHGEVTPPSKFSDGIPDWVDEVILHLLSKSPKERPASAREVLDILQQKSMSPITDAYIFAPKLRNNLPAQLTSFIGREKEVGQIKQRLEKNRLVTLTGSGGIGKTRLSIQVASELLDEYPNGVWLVELAPITDPTLVTQTVCAALDVTPRGNVSALNVLTDYLKPKKILLVVDNCEHLIDSAARLCEDLLHACPNVRIIASSREALGIDGENAYRVPSLSLPNPNDGLQTIEKSEAVKLFMERATVTLPEFEMTEANASVVAQICQRLDGIALAIELAASRVKLLKVEQIASRLDDAFRLLTGGSRTALPRQQTLRALIDWSYNLLSDEEQTALRCLSVFVGGWTLEAAEYVCDNPNMLDLLTHLVDKSLVIVDHEHDDEPRYYLLETIRQYAREKLTDSGEGEAVREKHTRWYVELAEHAEPKLRGHNQTAWLDRIEQEHDNLRAALEWSINNNVDLGLRIANSLIWFWDTRDHVFEGLQNMERLLAAGPLDPSHLHANALARASWLAMIAYDEERLITLLEAGTIMSREVGNAEALALSFGLSAHVPFWHGNYDQALQLAEEGLALFEEAGIKWGKQFTLSEVGYISQALGNYERAHDAYQESLRLSREVDDVSFIPFLLSCLGLLAFEQSHFAQALGLFQESLSLAREVKNRNSIAEALQSMGEVNIALKQYPQAKMLLEESIAIDREVGNFRRQAVVLNLLGRVARLQGEYKQAVRLNMESLQMAQRNGGRQTLAWCLVSLAELAALHNQPQKAARLFGAAESIPELHIAFWPHERIELEQISTKIRADLDNAIFNVEYEAGKQMSLDEAVAYALPELQ